MRSLLFISQQLPWPKDSGGNIRSYYLLRSLGERFKVTLVASAKTEQEAVEGRAALAPICHSIRIVDNSKSSHVGAKAKAVVASWTRRVPAFVHYNTNHEIAQLVESLLSEGDIDLVHLNHLDTFSYVASGVRVPFAIDSHNVLHDYYRRRAFLARNPISRAVFHLESVRLRDYELRAFQRAGLVLTCSQEEKEMLLEMDSSLAVEVIPNGVDTSYFRPAVEESAVPRADMVFMGDMAYPPNHDAVMEFIHEVLPLLHQTVPGIRLVVIGKAPQKALLDVAAERSDVAVEGFVEDVRDPLARAGAFVVPLRYGSGTRLKILSALSMGIPTVSTSAGAEGLACQDGENILIADEALEMAGAIRRVLSDRQFARVLSRKGRQTAEEHYDWHLIGEQLQTVYQERWGCQENTDS